MRVAFEVVGFYVCLCCLLVCLFVCLFWLVRGGRGRTEKLNRLARAESKVRGKWDPIIQNKLHKIEREY